VRIARPLTIAWVLLISACYQQPVISPQRPLKCNPAETKSECPKGYTCVPIGVCAPNSCQKDEDCPAHLTCSNRGCVAAPDGGAGDGSIQIPVLPDGGSPIDGESGPDSLAPAPADAAAASPDLSSGGNG
jgi:hypothetical protein